MKKYIMLLIISLNSYYWTGLCAFEPGSEVVVRRNHVNLRARNYPEAEVVGQIEQGKILIIKSATSNWVEIIPPSTIHFWVHKDFIAQKKVTVPNLNVRAGAGVNYNVVGRLQQGEKIVQRGVFGEWIKIAPPASSSLWISSKYVQLREPEKKKLRIAPPPPTPAKKKITLPPKKKKEPETTITSRIKRAPPPRPENLDLVPLEGQGQVVKREGILKAYFTRGEHPSRYYLMHPYESNNTILCYIENKNERARPFKGKYVIIQGYEYWVQGQSVPFIVPQAIIEKQR